VAPIVERDFANASLTKHGHRGQEIVLRRKIWKGGADNAAKAAGDARRRFIVQIGGDSTAAAPSLVLCSSTSQTLVAVRPCATRARIMSSPETIIECGIGSIAP